MAEESVGSGEKAGQGDKPARRLMDLVHEAARRRYFSRRTEEAYGHWIRRFVYFYGRRHPRELGEAEVTAFLSYLAAERNVAASTQNQALSALLFLYKEVLGRELAWLSGLQRATRPVRLPAVLHARRCSGCCSICAGRTGSSRACCMARGLRVLECLRLRVKDIDLSYRQGGRGVRSPLDHAEQQTARYAVQ
jgi:site-specific recombinase XerD